MSSRARASLFAMAGLALLCAGGSSHAQTIDTNEYAILAEGPEIGQGIDGIYPNIIPFSYASYLVAEEIIELYWVDGPITSIEKWPLAECRQRTIRSLEGDLYYYANSGGWSVLFRVVDGAANADSAAVDPTRVSLVCNFIDRFISRFLYFNPTVPATRESRRPAPAMPAIIELN